MSLKICMVTVPRERREAAHWELPELRYNRDPMDSHWMARLAPKPRPCDIQPRASLLQFTPRDPKARPGQPGKQLMLVHWMPAKRPPVKAGPRMMAAARHGGGNIWAEGTCKGLYWVTPDLATFSGELRIGRLVGASLRVGDTPYGLDGEMRHADGSPCGVGCKRCEAEADARLAPVDINGQRPGAEYATV